MEDTYDCYDDHGDNRTRIPHTHVKRVIEKSSENARETSNVD